MIPILLRLSLLKIKNLLLGPFIYDKLTIYYLIRGYEYEFRHHGAGTLVLWKADL
jgi:hypothetical protein